MEETKDVKPIVKRKRSSILRQAATKKFDQKVTQPVVNKSNIGTIAAQQDRLIDLIILNPSKSKAQLAIKAGYTANNVEKMMDKIWKGKKFQQRLQARRDEIAKRSEVSLDKVASEYARIAFLDHRDYYDFTEHGGIKLKDCESIDMRPILKVKETKTGKEPLAKYNVEIEFLNKMDALKALRDMFGYDKPAKHAHLIAGNGQGLSTEGLEASIIGLITGTPPTPPS